MEEEEEEEEEERDDECEVPDAGGDACCTDVASSSAVAAACSEARLSARSFARRSCGCSALSAAARPYMAEQRRAEQRVGAREAAHAQARGARCAAA